MDMDLFQPDVTPSQDGERTLICSCPKCSAKIEHELARVAVETTPSTCTACKARYVLTKESFARRASRKAGEINCAVCGALLGHSQFCHSCKTIYPDYYASEFPDAAKKRARQNRDLFGGLKNFSFEWHSSSAPSMDYKPASMDSKAWHEPVATKKKSFTAVISASVIVALIGVGVGFYYHVQAKKQFAASYVMALYGIKMGTDLGLQMCSRISADWISKGLTSPPRMSVDEENQLNNIKDKTETFVQKLNNPPSAFVESNQRLKNLNGLFLKVHAAALNPSGTPAGYVELTQKAGNEFKTAAADIKNNLPKELKAELDIAKAKYRGMGDF
jgi:hypothetical protein